MEALKTQHSVSVNPTDLITDNLDIWTSAIQTRSTAGRGSSKKLNLYGIKKLRELIMELAVRGKLVPQVASDEPASVLLERIAAEKAQQIKDKKLKKQRALPPISDDLLFDLPEGWCGCHLGDVYDVRDGTHDSPRPTATGFPLVTSKNLSSGRLDLSNIKYISKDDHLKIQERSAVNRDDILFAMIGSIGNPVLVDVDPNFSIKNVALFKYFVKAQSCPAFLRLFLEHASTVLRAQASGAVQSFVSLGKLRAFKISFPPLPEQHRIVAKVDELMALCDQLEQQTEASIDAHATLVETLLATLTNSADAAELEQNWTRIADHFDTLFTTDHSIDQLKQTVLQLAVMGKLVPQDPNDEPAAVLLEKIAAEKVQLVKEKKIKKRKPLVSFEGLDQMKYPLPDSWSWCRLEDTSDIVRGGSPRPAGDPKFYDGTIPFLKVGDVTRKSGKFVEGYNATIKEAGLKKTRLIEERTVLLSNSGATLGIPAICNFTATFNDGIAAFVERSEHVFDEFLYLYLANLSKWFLDIASRGQGQPNLNTDIVKATWFALPPLEEQHRIVAKVDQLMTLCDQLKAHLQQAQQSQLHLADAMGKKVFGCQSAVQDNSTKEEIEMKISSQLSLGDVKWVNGVGPS